MTYDVDYFIEKFSRIPARKWHMGTYRTRDGSKACALGHCSDGVDLNGTDEASERAALRILFLNAPAVGPAQVNDGSDPLEAGRAAVENIRCNTKQLGSSPKTRIMNALLLIKAGVVV